MTDPAAPNVCPVCKSQFLCGMQAGHERCWCSELPAVSPDASLGACLCPACLQRLSAEQKPASPPPADGN